MKDRLCPLCDRDWQEKTCPVHGVPTIGPSAGPAARLEVGTVLVGQYRIEGLMGQGGMGALLLATDLADGASVVVKVLRGERVGEIGNVRRFYQEARAARALSHPNIVRILQFGVDEATRAPFIAMEFVRGRTLKKLLAEDGPRAEDETAALFVSISRALSGAHAAHVLHRDLKPSNIMVEPTAHGPVVKVLDFGLAKILEDPTTAPLTQPGKTVGTPAFMSPEQVTQRPQDFRTDLYGLGCVLHATLTGSPPFTGGDLIEVMRKQMRQPAPPLPPVLVDGRPPSEALRNLHAALLAKAPDDRPPSTEAVVKAFIDLLGARSVPTLTASAQFEQARTQVDLQSAAEPPTRTLAATATPPSWGVDPAAFDDSQDDIPTPLFRPAVDPGPHARSPSMSGDDDFEHSLTSVMPASWDEREHEETMAPFASAAVAPPAVPVHPRPEGRRARLLTPAPSPVRVRRPTRWWAAAVVVAALLVVVFVAAALTPVRRWPGEVAPRTGPTPRAERPAAAEGRIQIRSVPEADVLVDGRWSGRTPMTIDRPSRWQHATLLLKQAGYRSQSLVVRHDTASPVEVRLRPM